MAKRKNTKRKPRDDRMTPTPELHRHGEVELPEISQKTARVAARRVPVIETMHRRGELSERDYRALGYYRDQALTAERSPTRDSLNFEVRTQSGGNVPPVVLSAMLETGRIERDLGSFRDIARAVAVEDKTLSQWCVEQYGGRERYDGKGSFVALVPVGELKALRIARLELCMAAGWISR